MKSKKMFAVMVSMFAATILLLAFTFRRSEPAKKYTPFVPPKGCVFQTIMGEESSDKHSIYKTPENVRLAVTHGLSWLMEAQQTSGGWGAGAHHRQEITNPHAVPSDPATTAMVAMAILRSGSTLSAGPYSENLWKALSHLLDAIENAPQGSLNITSQTGTQIQTKLGSNIDVILTSPFLSNILPHLDDQPELHARVSKCQNICVRKIQDAQGANGSVAGSGWAGVLQSSFATNALEAAEANGIDVDEDALARARQFQKNN